MKILIIGNGFDLAHGLPTKYTDFLRVCSIAKSARVLWNENVPAFSVGYSEKGAKELLTVFAKALGMDLYDEFYKIIRNCFWIEHFLEKESIIGGTWLNFEDEIKTVVESVIRDRDNAGNEVVRGLSNRALNAHCSANSFFQNKKTFKDLFELMMSELHKLTRALEIYMHGYVATIEVSKVKVLQNTQIDKVLSFNYTDTYTSIYDMEMECCYIHGEANKNKKVPCNMVLGFDDHYMDGVTVVPELVPFEKYCQRIVNRTDNQYYGWLEKMKSEDNTVYVYGHSLGAADGDVLKQFILSPNTRTVVYYLDDFDRAEKIKNLAIILGPNNLIQLTGGIKPIIVFKEIKEEK